MDFGNVKPGSGQSWEVDEEGDDLEGFMEIPVIWNGRRS